MKSTAGNDAETAVSRSLEVNGYKILDRNWRTKVCEIDIVAEKDKIIFFVEVKYRASDKQGGGFEYVTPKKLAQMKFAADVWSSTNSWEGDYRLLAAAVKGSLFEQIDIVEI